jgi:multiple sugar transport system permease protein
MAGPAGRLTRVVSYAVLVMFAIFTLFPIYWMFITSVKPESAVGSPSPLFIPWVQYQPTLQPFRAIFGDGGGYGVSGMGNVMQLFRNSFLSAFFSALIATVLGAMAAYALSRFRYRRWKNNDIAFWFVSQRMMPPIALDVPYFLLFGRIGQLDKVTTLIVVFAAGNLPLVIWLLRDYFQDLPIEIEEASMVDGTTQYGAFFRIALPLALPGLVVAFLFALTLSIDQAKTLPVQIAGNVTLRGPRYWDIAAQGLIVMLPPLVIALLVGKYIVRGLTLGAVK